MISTTLDFRPVSARLEYSSAGGRLISGGLQFLYASSAFTLTSGLNLVERSFIFHIHPGAECPYTKRIENPWLGALKSMHGTKYDFLT